MCQLDPTVEKMFATTIGEFVEQGRAFTGYDLTLRTREREKVKLRHADCRQGVHEMQLLIDLVEFDTWNKDLHDLGNGLQAILYYPSGYDKSLYQPVSVVQFVPSTPPLVSTTSSMAVGSLVISSLKVLKHILIIFKNLMRLLHKKVKNVYHRHIH